METENQFLGEYQIYQIFENADKNAQMQPTRVTLAVYEQHIDILINGYRLHTVMEDTAPDLTSNSMMQHVGQIMGLASIDIDLSFVGGGCYRGFLLGDKE